MKFHFTTYSAKAKKLAWPQNTDPPGNEDAIINPIDLIAQAISSLGPVAWCDTDDKTKDKLREAAIELIRLTAEANPRSLVELAKLHLNNTPILCSSDKHVWTMKNYPADNRVNIWFCDCHAKQWGDMPENQTPFDLPPKCGH